METTRVGECGVSLRRMNLSVASRFSATATRNRCARRRDPTRARRSLRVRASSVGLDLESALQRARDALDANDSRSYTLWGRGQHLGLPALWCLRTDDEAFVEETMNAELCYVSGRSRGREGSCWEVDFSGYAQRLELDDAEAATLGAWTRSGFWATRQCANEMLEMELLDDGREGGVCKIEMRLRRGGRVRGELELDASTWKPRRLRVAVCGDEDEWTFDDWTRDATSGLPYPRTTRLRGANGGIQEFIVTGAAVGRNKEGRGMFEKPTNEKPPTVNFDSSAAPDIPVLRAGSSHVLVEPMIDGESVGSFILDTGASGLVITPKAAQTLGLRAFGEVHVSGVSGRVPCQFRRGKDLKLGPLTLKKPVFMEMRLDGIVTKPPKPVAGIIGFDAFKSAILIVSEEGRRVQIYDADDKSAIDESWAWQELRLVSNVPHVAATFSGVNDSQKLEPNIFMIDSGAGGADVIFHAKAVKDLGLTELLGPEGGRISSRVRGVSGADGAGSSTLTYRTTMDWLQLASADANGTTVRFDEIDTLLASGEGFSLSEHSCGMICATLLRKKRIVYDVPRRRIAFVDE